MFFNSSASAPSPHSPTDDFTHSSQHTVHPWGSLTHMLTALTLILIHYTRRNSFSDNLADKRIWQINKNRPFEGAEVCVVFVPVQLKPACTTEHQITVVILYCVVKIQCLYSCNKSYLSVYWVLKYPVILLWHKFRMALSLKSFCTSMTLSIWSTVVFLLHSK